MQRFAVLAEIAELDGCCVLDLGCGYGDLKKYLDDRYTNYTYIGIEQMPEFIAQANARYGACPDTYFLRADFTNSILPEVDYILASGAFCYRCATDNFYPDMIQKMYAAARRGIGFNMLLAGAFPQHPLLIGHAPETIVAFCKSLSPRVRLVTDYLEDDFSVFVYKQ